MPASNFSINRFKEAVAQSGGLARPIFFECTVVCPALALESDLKLVQEDIILCKAMSIPEQTIDTVDIKYFTRSVPIPGSRQYSPVTLTFYNTANYKLRNYFEVWLELLNAQVHNRRREFPLSEITGTITLTHRSNNESNPPTDLLPEIQHFEFINAFPTSIGQLTFSYEDDTNVQTFDVTFKYLSMGSIEEVS